MMGLTQTTAYDRRTDSRRLDGCIRRMAGGDTEALRDLYEQAGSAVHGFALAMLRNPQDAEDVLQDTFVRAFACAGSYVSQGKPLAWMLTIARNLARMKQREGLRVLPAPDEGWEDRLPAGRETDPDDRLVLAAAMEILGDEERQIVMLHAAAGFRHREIAGLLELPLPTVLSKYHRALRKMKDKLTKEAE